MKQSITDWSNEKLEREIHRNPNDSNLWNELFTRLKPQLFPRALRACNGNVHDAEDLVQEVFLVMIEKLSEIKSLTGYAHGIMRNKCRQWIQQNQKTRGQIVFSESDEANEKADNLQSEQPNPLEDLVQDENVDEAFSVMEGLFERKPKHREIIRLKIFDKLSHKEIAVQLEIREGTSRRRLNRAITELTDLCDKYNITLEQLKHAIGRYYDEMPKEE